MMFSPECSGLLVLMPLQSISGQFFIQIWPENEEKSRFDSHAIARQ